MSGTEVHPVGESRVGDTIAGITSWIVGLIYFFPIAWMVITSFKTEKVANAAPTLNFTPTLDRYREVMKTTPGLLSAGEAFTTSALVAIISTVFVLALAIPAAYALSIYPVKKWRDVLFFFISTKFLPMVASILPLWILARQFDLLNTRRVLVILYMVMNIPLAVWMLRSFFQEVPKELVEAAEIDGTSLIGQLRQVIMPIALPGIVATGLLCLIFAWNEYFFAVQLNAAGSQTVPIWVTGNVSTRGDFIAKLSAASVMASIPVVVAGWFAQKRMIRGLAMGAIK